MQKSILIIYTGGTIGMITTPDKNSLTPFNFEEIRKHVPEIEKYGHKFSAYTIHPAVDSSNIKPESWIKIAELIEKTYDEYDGFIVLHGTDTMSFSASALSFMLEGLGKPVIFTGSQLPVTSLRTDARENLIAAIEIAAAEKDGAPLIPEVCIYFEFKLLRGNRCTKYSAEDFNAFISPNYPALAESGVRLKYHLHRVQKLAKDKQFKVHTKLDNNIAILKIFPGISEHVLDAVLGTKGLKAIILETFGAGNAPTDSWFFEKINAANEAGVVFLNISQCSEGSVEMGRYETSEHLIKAGVASGFDSTPEAAITKLMFLLGQELPPSEIKLLLNKSMNGEITIS